MKKVKGFNFDTVEDAEILTHIEKQGNQSQYIKNLVKVDMKQGNVKELIRAEVDNYMEEIANKVKGYR